MEYDLARHAGTIGALDVLLGRLGRRTDITTLDGPTPGRTYRLAPATVAISRSERGFVLTIGNVDAIQVGVAGRIRITPAEPEPVTAQGLNTAPPMPGLRSVSSRAARSGSCGCACQSGQPCGGCGHRGCRLR